LPISPAFYEQLLRQYSFAKKLQRQIEIREKLCKTLSYEKGARKLVVKWTPYNQQSTIIFLKQKCFKQLFYTFCLCCCQFN